MQRSHPAAYACLKASTALASIMIGVLAASSVCAQDAAARKQDKKDDAVEVVITGSAIRTRLDTVVVPVTVLNHDTIEKSGVATNALDIIRKAVPTLGGRSAIGNTNASNTNQVTAGGSSINLRNLDTLVLVNGRRVAPDSVFAVAGPNAKIFVNVSEIPTDAIDHIEVLTDGASAIYGSDAIGGVVNIILKNNYRGGEIDARVGVAAGGYSERSIGATYGFNPFKNTNITASVSSSESSPLYQNQRSFASPFYSTNASVPGAIGNYFLNPGITAPTPGAAASIAADSQYSNAGATIATAPGSGIGGTYDLSRYQMLLLKQQQKAAALSLNSDLSGNKTLELFGDAQVSQNKSFTQFTPVTNNVTAPAGSAFDPLTTNVTTVFGSTANPRQFLTTENAARATLGLRGKFPSLGHLNWEVAYTHSENTLHTTIANVIFVPNLAAAVAGGYNASGVPTAGGAYSMVHSGPTATGALVLQPALNPFAIAAGVAPGALNNVLTDETLTTKARLNTWDAKVSGTVGRLPAGEPSYAVGVSWREDYVSGTPDPNAWIHYTGSIATGGPQPTQYVGGVLSDPYTAKRTVTAQYVEVKLPITSESWNLPGIRAFDLILAERHEKYSDFGSASVPKIGFRWVPEHEITIRGNYAQSYTAPSLAQLYAPINVSSVGAAVFTNAFPNAISATGIQEGGGNVALQPAKSNSRSLGILYKPDFISGLRFDLEYSDIVEHGQIAGIGLNNILIDVNRKGSASQFFHNVSINALPGASGAAYFANPGDVQAYVSNPANVTGGQYTNLYLKDVPTNLGFINVKSLNLATTYAWQTDKYGAFTLASQVAYLMNFRYSAIPGQPIYEFAGTTTQGGGAQGTLPKWKSYTTLDWHEGPWNGGVGVTYLSAVQDIGTGGFSYFTNYALNPVAFAPGRVPSWTSWDLRLSYDAAVDGKGWRVTVGVNNLFDSMPPISSNIDPTGGHAAGATAWRAENNTDLSAYGGGIGRLVYMSVSSKF